MVWSKKIPAQYQRLRHLRLYSYLHNLKIRRSITVLPNIFTLGNAFFGFCSIVSTAHGDLVSGAYFILIGALMDGLDGRIARFTGTTSDLGMQLDSLCDAISFCLAPALLMYAWQLNTFGFFGLINASLFLLMGLLRLARFNITHNQQTIYFLGLPTTIAGCFLATIFLNIQSITYSSNNAGLFFCITPALALLMISHVHFPAYKKLHKKYYSYALAGLFAFTIIMGLLKVLFALFIGYFCATLAGFAREKLRP